jgi:predicted amino acid dehydrogenase
LGKFGFIIHPLELQDLSRKLLFSDRIPEFILEKLIKLLPQIKVSHITGLKSSQGPEAEGCLIGCTLTSKQMMELPPKKVLKQIIKAAKKAQKAGAKIIGLGAYTSIVGDKGVTVSKHLDVPVTTGNSYTVATAIEAVKLAASKLDLDLQNINVAIIGATGSIGKACARLLAFEVEDLTLVARNELKLKEFANFLKKKYIKRVNYCTNVNEALTEAQIIITVSSSINSIIDVEKLNPGSIVCDVARPRDVAKQVNKRRDDILVIEGGLVEMPGSVDLNFDLGLPANTIYACMAETMILALEGRYENYTIGKDVCLEKVKEIQRLAKKHGFKLAGLRYLQKEVSEQQFAKVREAVLST